MKKTTSGSPGKVSFQVRQSFSRLLCLCPEHKRPLWRAFFPKSGGPLEGKKPVEKGGRLRAFVGGKESAACKSGDDLVL